MSETVFYMGKVKEVEPQDGEDLEALCKRLCEKNNYEFEDEYYLSCMDCLVDEGYEKYAIIGDKIYETVYRRDFEDDEIMEALRNDDGSIGFKLKYYTGGASFSEALERAITKMEGEG